MQGYRTFIVAALMAAFGALAIADWNAVFVTPYAGIVAIVAAVLMAVLRAVTTTPPGVTSPAPVDISIENDKKGDNPVDNSPTYTSLTSPSPKK